MTLDLEKVREKLEEKAGRIANARGAVTQIIDGGKTLSAIDREAAALVAALSKANDNKRVVLSGIEGAERQIRSILKELRIKL
jgi:photosystem II stability/assembly factor-like uncharacterized protein